MKLTQPDGRAWPWAGPRDCEDIKSGWRPGPKSRVLPDSGGHQIRDWQLPAWWGPVRRVALLRTFWRMRVFQRGGQLVGWSTAQSRRGGVDGRPGRIIQGVDAFLQDLLGARAALCRFDRSEEGLGFDRTAARWRRAASRKGLWRLRSCGESYPVYLTHDGPVCPCGL